MNQNAEETRAARLEAALLVWRATSRGARAWIIGRVRREAENRRGWSVTAEALDSAAELLEAAAEEP